MRIRLLLVLVFFLLANNALSIEFANLPAQEKNLLQAAQPMWSKLDAQTQAQLRAQAQHWLTLSSHQQQTLLLKQRQWDSLSFAEKSKERARYAAWKSLGIVEQAKISAAYRQWHKLPVEQQQALKAKFAQQLPEYRQAWILGPALGKEAQVLQDWLLFLPQEQIRPWLMLLRELRTEERDALVKLGKRKNQAERDTFRTRLLSAPPEARADLIQNALLQ